MKTTITILSVLLIFLMGTVKHNVFGQDHSEEKKKILQAIENDSFSSLFAPPLNVPRGDGPPWPAVSSKD